MSKRRPIPPEQRSSTHDRTKPEQETRDRREETTELQSSQPGDDDVNLKQQGRYGNIRQNTHNQGYQQDR
jgi:hypothetical protein